MKTILKNRFLFAVLTAVITVSCEPLFSDVQFPVDPLALVSDSIPAIDSTLLMDSVSLLNSLPTDSVNIVETDSSYQPNYVDSAYLFSNNIFYPLDTERIDLWTYSQNVEGILSFQGWYDQIDYNDPSTVIQKTSKLVLFFTTEVQPGTYDIIPVPAGKNWVSVDILLPEWSDRSQVPSGKCIGYFTAGTNVPTNEWYFWDSLYMSRIREFTTGQVKIEKVDQIYHIEVKGNDNTNTEVELHYSGTLNTRSIAWYGTVDPNFWIPHYTNGI